jgi:hypothetical protein
MESTMAVSQNVLACDAVEAAVLFARDTGRNRVDAVVEAFGLVDSNPAGGIEQWLDVLGVR